jgi:hypothetical protein
MKEETVVYIRVPSPPKKVGHYFTGAGECFWTGRIWTYEKYDRETDEYYQEQVQPLWWLQETPLSSLLQEGAVEFLEWTRKRSNYPVYKASELFKLFIEEKYGKETK